ncbi:MAG TPA: aldehyde dehydrogenase family protein, partial [Candidatus Obscuribacterales bacterium]
MQTLNDLTHYPMVIGADTVTTGRQELIDPATGEVFATVAVGTPAEVAQAVAAAKAAQPAWAALSVGERSAALMAFANALEAKSEELARLESQNGGKPL